MITIDVVSIVNKEMSMFELWFCILPKAGSNHEMIWTKELTDRNLEKIKRKKAQKERYAIQCRYPFLYQIRDEKGDIV